MYPTMNIMFKKKHNGKKEGSSLKYVSYNFLQRYDFIWRINTSLLEVCLYLLCSIRFFLMTLFSPPFAYIAVNVNPSVSEKRPPPPYTFGF